jgi:trk system potassium uptake protein TrkA
MKIIILGAGQVGGTLAATLANEDKDITVVDLDATRLKDLQSKLDIGTVQGMGCHPNVLKQAGAQDADMLIAVTNSDEINMVACQVASTLFNTPDKIARIRSSNYTNQKDVMFKRDAVPVDHVISPERAVTNHIQRLLEFPDALQVLDFADRRVQLVAVRALKGGPLIGHELKDIREHMPNVDTRVAAIFRKDSPIIPTGDTIIQEDDEVFFIAARSHIRDVMSELRELEGSYKRITIAGGGNIGERLAKDIEHSYKVRVIERNYSRCEYLSNTLDKAIVLHGDASNQELLLEENIEETDVFCALTNEDEANIMSCLLAKKLGARKVMALINNPAYVDLVQGGKIDIAISPQQSTIGSLLSKIRRGDVVSAHSLRRGAAEAIEAIAHGDKRSSKVVGKQIDEIKLPEGTTIGAIVRGDEVIIAHHDTVIESDDHVIMFLVDKRKVPEVERLFQPSFLFF